jgi:hypothetical protein
MARGGGIALFLCLEQAAVRTLHGPISIFDPFDFAQDKFLDLRLSID